jgi:hypothetical protein
MNKTYTQITPEQIGRIWDDYENTSYMFRIEATMLNKWLTALRSGQYQQAESFLKAKRWSVATEERASVCLGDGHCCLGVLQEAVDGDVEKAANGHALCLPTVEWYRAHGITDTYIDNAQENATYSLNVNINGSEHLGYALSTLNDAMQLSFEQIADQIEQSAIVYYKNQKNGRSFTIPEQPNPSIIMNEEQFNKWIADLVFGEYDQAQGYLCSPKTGGYCCLGVLQKGLDGKVETYEPTGQSLKLPSKEWLYNHGVSFFTPLTTNPDEAVGSYTVADIDHPFSENLNRTNPWLLVHWDGEPKPRWTTIAELNDSGFDFETIAEILKRITKVI